MIEKQDFTVNEKVYPLEKFAALLRDVRYIPLIDAGVSMKTAFAMEKGSEMNVFVKKGGAEYVAKVWPGNVHFVDFLHPNSTTYWTNMFRTLHDKVKFSGVWLDMNEVSNF
jgi:alpha-glucosidase (family GH31 glycosyl hydrolase)